MAYTYKPYEESQRVQDAQQALDAQNAGKPADYQSQWGDQINSQFDKIMNREAFNYDVNADAIWQQYKDSYINGGQMAMMDTMGQAAGMTGGYGNSYAQMAGNQVYQQYLKGMTDQIPNLAQAAYGRYQDEGDRMMQQYGMMADREQQDYSRYQDQYDQWSDWQKYLSGRLDTEREFDLNQYYNDRDFSYQQYRDNQAQAMREVEYYIRMGKNPDPALVEAAGYTADYVKQRLRQQQAQANGQKHTGIPALDYGPSAAWAKAHSNNDTTAAGNGNNLRVEQDDALAFAQTILANGGSYQDIRAGLYKNGLPASDITTIMEIVRRQMAGGN